MTYQILESARRRYEVPQPFVDEIGAVRFSVREEVRRLEYLMRSRGAAEAAPARTAGGLLALGVLNDVQRRLVQLYRSGSPRDPFGEASSAIAAKVGEQALRGCYLAYSRLFPPREPEPTIVEARGPDLLGELLFLFVANRNPGAAAFAELFADGELRGGSAYEAVLANMESWAGSSGPAIGWGGGIVALLMAPILYAPGSLIEQLHYIRERWGNLLGDLMRELLLAIDVLREESRPRWGGAPGPSPLPRYGRPDEEPERYSADLGWMPRLVLIAKHALVWLHQLSVRYGRSIRRLDEVPDAELDELEASGFTGLWLIGIWMRSPASQTIKRRCGNPEAVGSAYAIVDYRVSPDIGGAEAAKSLSGRCAARGIRLGCDMVPNHTALDARLVAEHPDWFVQSPFPPFPGYRFSGESVGGDAAFQVRIEDHYYDRSDAAVVFERRDQPSGRRRYLYHGNDGTSTPWNDTAQLDFLSSEVREAVASQILAVAGAFPIIRFDAAMVLTRKHFQRLWYPPPGSGGDIPSRAEHGLDPEEFDRRMPVEFWREIVDRVAAEAPETLLLAEAFWLLEGYFVRTLGMHRVYNSAFMNMLKAEDNARYRQLLKSTLEYDPEILKRYVNFMSNPDEDPAAVQFGTGDKYFGIAVMMATLPGLPMFGHGQVQGFKEKYGMEYCRSYQPEEPDSDFVERHRREIFPLLRLRSLFAEVVSFRLYDFWDADGKVNEDVFAYSNRMDASFALVVYNNRYERAEGWLSQSVAFRDRVRGLVRRSLGEEIGLSYDERCFCVFRDVGSGLEYIRPSRLFLSEGLHVGIDGFHYHVFLDFRELRDDRLGHYARLAAELGGAGLPSVEQRIETYFAPVHDALAGLVRPGSPGELPRLAVELYRAVLGVFSLPIPDATLPWQRRLSAMLRTLSPSRAGASRLPSGLGTCLRKQAWLLPVFVAATAVAAAEEPVSPRGWSLARELRIPEGLSRALLSAGTSTAEADRAVSLLALVATSPLPELTPEAFFATSERRSYLGVNWFDGSEWFRREPLEDLIRYLQLASLLDGTRSAAAAAPILKAAEKAGYRVEAFLEASRRPRAGRRVTPRADPRSARKESR